MDFLPEQEINHYYEANVGRGCFYQSGWTSEDGTTDRHFLPVNRKQVKLMIVDLQSFNDNMKFMDNFICH